MHKLQSTSCFLIMLPHMLDLNPRSYVTDAVLYDFDSSMPLAVMNDCMTYTPERPGRVIVQLLYLSINF